MVETLVQVADLSQPDGSYLGNSDQEYSDGMSKFFRASQSVLHHVDAVSSLWEALPVENEYGEVEAHVEDGVVLVRSSEGLVEEHSPNESHLDDEHEERSVEDVDLIARFETVLLLVGSHKGRVRDGVHVGSELVVLRHVLLSRLRSASSAIHSSLRVLEHLSGSFLLAARHGSSQQLD